MAAIRDLLVANIGGAGAACVSDNFRMLVLYSSVDGCRIALRCRSREGLVHHLGGFSVGVAPCLYRLGVV